MRLRKRRLPDLSVSAQLCCGAAVLLLLIACVGPDVRFGRKAYQHGFQRKELTGTEFNHAVFYNRRMAEGSRLHVYLGGDGSPWIRENWVSSDPTPRKPVALQLMAQDDMPSIYLGRPCYHGGSSNKSCKPLIWTDARYSMRVVDSLERALRHMLQMGGYAEIVLIGYSGGGTLAMLLAPRFKETKVVITLAGNLDIDAWASSHQYSPLISSLNPEKQPPLPAEIQQYHLVGGADANVPAEMTRAALLKQQNVQFIVWETFDHSCCWASIWQPMLACVKAGCVWPG